MTRHTTPSRRRGRIAATVAAGLALTLALAGCAPMFDAARDLVERVTDRGPDTDFTDFAAQEASWSSCGDGFECARVFAPLDWNEPESERITLAMIRQPALGGDPLGTIFVNPGGPGASAIEYLRYGVSGAVTEDLQEAYDIVAWDPRGVGSSSAVACLDDAEMDAFLFDIAEGEAGERGSEEWLAAAAEETRDYAAACIDGTGPLLEHVDTMSTVRDLDMLRAIVGDERLHYIGYSYGTAIGARYADTFPDRVGRLVLDGATDPTTTEAEVVREQTLGFEAALRAYAADCLTRAECPFSGSVDEAMAEIGALIDQVDASPIPASDGRVLGADTMLTAIITPLYAQGNWPYLDQLFASVAAGDADVAFTLADFYYDRVDGEYQSNLMEAFLAINCLDYPRDAELDLDALRAEAAELAEIAPTIGRYQGFGDVFCANWPFGGDADREPVRAEGAAPILVVGTTGDPATPYRWAVSLAEQLESGVLVTYVGEGHTAYGKNSCINETVDAYFLTGAVPEADPNCGA